MQQKSSCSQQDKYWAKMAEIDKLLRPARLSRTQISAEDRLSSLVDWSTLEVQFHLICDVMVAIIGVPNWLWFWHHGDCISTPCTPWYPTVSLVIGIAC